MFQIYKQILEESKSPIRMDHLHTLNRIEENLRTIQLDRVKTQIKEYESMMEAYTIRHAKVATRDNIHNDLRNIGREELKTLKQISSLLDSIDPRRHLDIGEQLKD